MHRSLLIPLADLLATDSPGSSRDLAALGWDAHFAEHFRPFAADGLVAGRVAIEHKRGYRVYTERGEVPAEASGKFRHRAASRADFPAVGDWVALRPPLHEGWVRLDGLLPRKSRFARQVAGATTDEQIVAANVDTVFLLAGLDGDFNPRRIERYLALARDSGAAPVVVLNKTDVSDDLAGAFAEARGAAPGVPIHAISCARNEGLDALAPYLILGRTVALLGSSGVGKSSLVNRLVGEELLRTREVRRSDQRGRHTTTRRELIVLPRGGVLMDTPGMRELQLPDVTESLEDSFGDVEALATDCHFPACRHGNEPRCAVRAAIQAGTLSPGRLDNYDKLRQELASLEARRPGRARAARQREIKEATRAFNQHRPRD